MPSNTSPAERRFPLHVHISALFTLLLLLTGVVLGLFNYRQTSAIILSSSAQLFGRIQQEVQLDLERTYTPIRHTLGLLALHPASDAANLSQRLSLLAPFAQTLSDNPKLASLYLGYENGDFFMVRRLRESQRMALQAPSEAAFQVWSIEQKGDARVAQFLFFDTALQLIEGRSPDSETFDPRVRSWYQLARDNDLQITTAPYVFFSTGEIGTTLARRTPGKAVLAADMTLVDLSATLAAHKVTPATEVLLFDAQGRAVAYPDSTRLVVTSESAQLIKAGALSAPLAALLDQHLALMGQAPRNLRLGDRQWVVSLSHIAEGGPEGLNLALLVPEDELLVDAYRIRWQGGLMTLGILLLCLPLGWLSSRLVVRPLRALVQDAEAIGRFDFRQPSSGRSPVLEVDQLALSMAGMKKTLSSFLEIAASLSAETHFESLLKRVLQETVAISAANGGLLYLVDADSGRLEPQCLFLGTTQHNLDAHHVPVYASTDDNMPAWLRQPAAGGASATTSLGFDQAGDFRSLLQTLDSPRAHLLATGLHNRRGETVGVLVLLHRDNGDAADLTLHRPERVAFVEAVSGVAALCIDSQRLLEKQKQLLDAFIQLLAGAIDAKSPYTGGHCQRVPELTLMLAQAAADCDEPAFAHYRPGPEEWQALHTAAWLHDCGKITTPEYVVDKATKLETLYDRLHEIRMRFEVLKRDAWIDYWQACCEGGSALELAAQRDRQLAILDAEFSFVARCNLGTESMAGDDQQRLQRIAARRWTRTLDDRIGLSWEENQRQERTPAPPLPVEEPLLGDRPAHLVERLDSERMPTDNPWGFKLDVPEYKFNRGELYNLSIGRGTLTREERFLINDHMVQTIRMLSHLPFPPHLKQVAEIAGGHHEKMDGSGYPKRLKRDEMSLPARMMAIADIFEALTAADRPYKKGKPLSEALAIMADMCRTGHIDPELFGLFLGSEIHLRYAAAFLKAEQIDAVDTEQLLERAGVR
ncbi:MAG: HD domain-containing phosphohydrolase [Pseudomonas sp.]|uniref:HD domain-containing phosphohydrolase n=1 Tax=Pseudomonas sp. TaxID=306 RepID=UPI0033965DCC